MEDVLRWNGKIDNKNLGGKQEQLRVNTKHEKATLGDLFGIFFEDLNHAADGGLYAELVQNRSFEFCKMDNPEYDHLTGWERMGTEDEISLEIEDENPFCQKNPHYLVMEKKAAEEKKESFSGKEGTISDSAEEAARLGVRNTGFYGIPLKAGSRVRFYFLCQKAGIRGNQHSGSNHRGSTCLWHTG